jgi:uncharacterized damage-inducible protein DinB
MDIFFSDYLDRLGDLHNDCKSTIEDLPQAALDWSPIPEMNSIAILIVHIAGAERYWFGDAIAEQPSGRDREGEFNTSDLMHAKLLTRLDEAYQYIESVIAGMKLPDLIEPRISPRDGRQVTVGWSMLHVLKHTALHLGHIEYLRHSWLMKTET